MGLGFQASSSCDGTIRIWSVNPKKVVKTISGLPKTNDFGSTKTLCRLAWDRQGEVGRVFCFTVELYACETFWC